MNTTGRLPRLVLGLICLATDARAVEELTCSADSIHGSNLASCCADSQPPAAPTWGDASKGFFLTQHDGTLDIHLNGRRIASYVYRHPQVKRPFFSNVMTTRGTQITRRFPPVEGEDPTDHADMHPGLWLAFGKLGGVDFWRNQGRVVHEDFFGEPTAGQSATFTTVSRCEAPDSAIVCRQRTAYRIVVDASGYLIAMDASFSSDKPFHFGVQEEMGFGIRVATPIRVKGGNGAILSSDGGRNESGTWGKTARWWDYYGRIGGRTVGLMLMSAAGNPNVWAHSRDYGVLVANPFPVDRPENRAIQTTIKPGAEFRLRFGVLVHDQLASEQFDRKSAYDRYERLEEVP